MTAEKLSDEGATHEKHNEQNPSFASRALTALFLLLALASVALMRGHAAREIAPPSYKITLTPQDGWESWMPTTGVGESSDTETIVFTAATDATPSGEGSITFALSGVTSYEGRYMNDSNWNLPDNTGADLYFAPAAEQDQTLYTDANGKSKITWSGGDKDLTSVTASWTTRPVKTPAWIVIPVNIVCNDYAAYGEIQATVSAGGKTSKSDTLTIPKDDGEEAHHYRSGTLLEGVAGNKLADEWDRNHLYWYGSSTIMDTQTADRFTEEQTWRDRDQAGEWRQSGVNSGDGFTVFEEYRGFMIGGIHRHLHPEYKDVFIRSEVGPNGETGYARNLPMEVHIIGEDEWDGNHVNFCQGGIGGILQRPIHIYEDRSPIPVGAENVIFGGTIGPDWPEPYTPNNSDCVIYTVRIRQFYNDEADAILPIVIAHEAGHAVNLEHHSLVLNAAGEVVFPVADSDVCVMVNPVRDAATYIRWAGMGYAHTHNTPPGGDPLDGDDWENHDSKYKLHSNHEGQLTYDQY